MSGFYYLATPYSRFPGGIDAAFRLACEASGLLLKARVPFYCPIAETHAIAMACGVDPLDHSIWLTHDEPLMEAASGLIVLMADTWEESYGISVEIAAFRAAGKPILYMEPGSVPAELVQP